MASKEGRRGHGRSPGGLRSQVCQSRRSGSEGLSEDVTELLSLPGAARASCVYLVRFERFNRTARVPGRFAYGKSEVGGAIKSLIIFNSLDETRPS